MSGSEEYLHIYISKRDNHSKHACAWRHNSPPKLLLEISRVSRATMLPSAAGMGPIARREAFHGHSKKKAVIGIARPGVQKYDVHVTRAKLIEIGKVSEEQAYPHLPFKHNIKSDLCYLVSQECCWAKGSFWCRKNAPMYRNHIKDIMEGFKCWSLCDAYVRNCARH